MAGRIREPVNPSATIPSLEILRPSDGVQFAVPGFQPLAAYELAVANLAPWAERRADP